MPVRLQYCLNLTTEVLVESLVMSGISECGDSRGDDPPYVHQDPRVLTCLLHFGLWYLPPEGQKHPVLSRWGGWDT